MLSRLLVAAHYEFHRSTSMLIAEATPAALMLTELATKHQIELNILFKLVNRAQGSAITQKIIDADNERDGLLGELFVIVDRAAQSKVATRREPALLLKRAIAPYRGIAANEYAKETAQIRGMLRDIATDEMVSAQDAVGIAILVQELKKANNKLAEYLKERNEETATRADDLSVNTEQQRKVIDAVYHDIVDRVNAVANLQPTDEVLKYIGLQNALIDQYKNIITHMRAGGTGTEKGTSPKPEETPEE